MSRPRSFVRAVHVLSILVLVGGAAACAHEIGPHVGQPAQPLQPRPVPASTPLSAATPGPLSAPPKALGGGPASAVAAMSQAIRMRCAREERCDNIGVQRPYASIDDCIANVAVIHADDFAGLHCEGGVRADALTACLQEISRERCVPGARFASCRSIGLCNSI